MKVVFKYDHDNDFAVDHLNKILAYGRGPGITVMEISQRARLIDLDQNNDIKTTVIEYDS